METLAQLIERAKGFAAADSPAQALECVDCARAIDSGRLCDECALKRGRVARAVEALRSVPGAFHWARFSSALLGQRVAAPEAIARARTHRDASRVVLTGASGTGKTSLVVAMVRDRIERGTYGSVFFAPAWRLGVSRARAEDSEPELVRRALRADLLVLDDLGSERPVASNPVPDVIFERHAEDRATWVTTWMTPEQLTERYGDGIARRVFERAVLVECAPPLPISPAKSLTHRPGPS